MSAEFAIALALLSFGSMWACWKLGHEAGQNEILDQFRDYCEWRDSQKITPCRDNQQGE
jgi:hypothetical protein